MTILAGDFFWEDNKMHTCRTRLAADGETEIHEAGFSTGDVLDTRQFRLIGEFATADEAAKYASFLNGGAAGSAMPLDADARKKRDDKIAKRVAEQQEQDRQRALAALPADQRPAAPVPQAPEPERKTRSELEELTKEQLASYATQRGIEVDTHVTKDEMIDAIVKGQRAQR